MKQTDAYVATFGFTLYTLFYILVKVGKLVGFVDAEVVEGLCYKRKQPIVESYNISGTAIVVI